MDFEAGKKYSRLEIQNQLGGSLDQYLPHKDGRVVCGCFKLRANPSAPRVLLVDAKPEIMHWAEVLCQQVEPIPLFIKGNGEGWRYVGMFAVRTWFDDVQHLWEQEELVGRRRLGRIIVMKPVTQTAQ